MHVATTTLLIITLLLTFVSSCPTLFSFSDSNTCSIFTNDTISRIQEPPLLLSPIEIEISSLTTLLRKLSSTASLYDGSLQQTFDLAKIVKEVKLKLGKTTADLGSGERVGQGLGRSVTPIAALEDMARCTEDVLDVLVMKAPTIATAGYKSLVFSELGTLAASTDLFFDALGKREQIDPRDGDGGVEEVKEEQDIRRLQRVVRQMFKKVGGVFVEDNSGARTHMIHGGERDRNQFVKIGMGSY
ncbi:uncharacterized protein RAG0_07331 [Rhynchosporium agropyri]|uniref:Uncharacterized protein n=1 Tax=Rhynchosporium agropyri TaxID=914238 RepID=A0A1E1KL19_9HELO|nr:uncharacterized protein RAG0_07331 [Rhynchosporium agropyri]